MRTILLPNHWIVKLQLKAVLIFTLVSFLFPFFIHFIAGTGDIPLGARILPMFYAPFIAAFFYRYHVALIAAIAAPMLNFLVTGHPNATGVMILAFELGAFVSLVHILRNRMKVAPWLIAPLSYVLALGFAALILGLFMGLIPGPDPMDFFINSLSNGLIGVVLLLLINIIACKIQAQKRF